MSGKPRKSLGMHYRPATASPVFWTETSTQMTVSPRSMVTPSPQLLHTELCSPEPEFRSYATPNNSRATTDSDISHLSAKLQQTAAKELRTSRPDMWLKLRSSDWERTTAASLQIKELGTELKSLKTALREKDQFVRELQQVIINLEKDLNTEKAANKGLTQQNTALKAENLQFETNIKDQVNAAIQRLTALLAEGSRKLKALSKPLPIAAVPLTGSQEFSAYLLEENKDLSAELKKARKDLKEGFVGVLEPLVYELAAIKSDIVQLRTLLKGARAGEQVRLDVLWGLRQSPDPGLRPASYSLTCMQEVTAIREAIADMKQVAADIYAEQCGQGCISQ